MIGLKEVTVFLNQSVAAGATEESTAVEVPTYGGKPSGLNGYFSIQATITGDGTVKIGYICSNDGTNYVAPEDTYSGSNFAPIVTGLTKTSGPGGDGKILIKFEPQLAKYYKIVATETGTSATVTISATLVIY